MALGSAEYRPPRLVALAQGLDLLHPRARHAALPAVAVPGTMTTDAALVALHLSGDPRAFAELVKRYTRAIYNVTYRFTGNAQEAENLTQETFLRAWNVLPRVGVDRPLKPYFVQIAVNLCRDWAASKKVDLLPIDAEDMELPNEDGDPLEAIGAQELRERVRVRMEALPPLYRMVLTLRYTEDMSYEEIASALELPLNTVRTHLRHAKARLRELLEGDPA